MKIMVRNITSETVNVGNYTFLPNSSQFINIAEHQFKAWSKFEGLQVTKVIEPNIIRKVVEEPEINVVVKDEIIDEIVEELVNETVSEIVEEISNPLQCEYCGFVAKSKRGLKRHISVKHDDVI